MADRIWDRYLTERDKQVLVATGYGQRAGFGKRPALIVVDVNYNFTGDRSEPILESIKRWPNSCGEEAWEAMRHIKRLLDAARNKELPVIYCTSAQRTEGWGAWAWKNNLTDQWRATYDPTQMHLDGNEINHEIAPMPQDIVIKKLKPSAFHGTPLSSLLRKFQADSLIMVGTTTSGCLRASVLDAFSENYRLTLAEEGCFDRSEASHAINLWDMNAKYADVVATDECIAYIESLPDGLFKLPLE